MIGVFIRHKGVVIEDLSEWFPVSFVCIGEIEHQMAARWQALWWGKCSFFITLVPRSERARVAFVNVQYGFD